MEVVPIIGHVNLDPVYKGIREYLPDYSMCVWGGNGARSMCLWDLGHANPKYGNSAY